MPRPLRVFLCHASQDKPAVRELYNALKSEGWIDPWLDKAKILPGQDWEMVIDKAVDDSDVVVICLSSQSLTKEGFVQKEIRYAYDIALEKPEDTIFLIPLRLDDCNVPHKLRTFHWVDYFGAEKVNAFSDLLEALKLRYEQKARLEMEQGNAEIAAREKAKREARIKAKREAAEKAERERMQREQMQWEFAQKAVREKAQREQSQREAARKPVPGKSEYETAEKTRRDTARKSEQRVPVVKPLPIALGSLGFLALIGIFLIAAYFALKWFLSSPAPALTEAPVATQPPAQEPAATEPPAVTDAPTENPVLGIGSTMIGMDGMTLLYVPAGDFVMGSDKGDPDEEPVHQVSLDAFWIDQTEVTNEMYSVCVAADACKQPLRKGSFSNPRYYDNHGFDNYPVMYVDWDMAKAYCEWAGRALPTEAQWEKAARGVDGNMYPWGNDFNGKLVNFCDVNCPFAWAYAAYNDDYADVSPVGNYPAGQSVYGALDMAGNVWEWVDDWYDVYPGGTTTSSKFGQKYRVLRGGSWYVNMHDVRSSERYIVDLSDSFNYFTGFRCARSTD